MKKIILSVFASLVLYSIVQIGNAFSSDLPEVNEPVIGEIQENKLEKMSDESKTEIISDSEKTAEEIGSIEHEKTKEKKNEIQTTTIQENEKVDSKATEVPKQEQQNVQQEQQTQIQVKENNQPSQNTPWNNLGISEYDYYNKPAHSWAELDFKLSNYGTREATLAACKAYGDNYTNQNGGMYFCDPVESYSGAYLGEDYDYIKNN